MKILTFSDARAGLKQAMDTVCNDHAPTIITRPRGEHVVMISLEDFNGMQETMHLLGSPKNASRLMESIAQLRAGGAKPRNAFDGQQEDDQQGGSKTSRRQLDGPRVGRVRRLAEG